MVAELHTSKYKISLQYGAIIAGIVLVSQLGVNNVSIGKLATSAYDNLANVASMSASVAPNQYNTLALQFDQKDKELSAREQDLMKREQNLDIKYQEAIAANKRTVLYVLGGITLLLLLLILLNFYFDVKREEDHEREAIVSHPHHEGGFTTQL